MDKKNKIIIKIHSGLGNQLFLYAYARALSIRNNVDFLMDISDYETYFRPFELDIFNIKKKYASKKDIPFYQNWAPSILRGLLMRSSPKYHWEDAYWWRHPILFNKKFLGIKNGYIWGHFLSEKYFIDEWDEIKSDFEFIKPISKETKIIENNIKSFNTISIHMRRGDFLKYPETYPILSKRYYMKAIEIIKNKIDNPFFVIFSDDIDYVSKYFSDLNNKIIISHNKGDNSWQDMYLMSKCKHNITAHSTFGRWGAYLNNNNNKIVITPKERFMPGSPLYKNDLIPVGRISI